MGLSDSCKCPKCGKEATLHIHTSFDKGNVECKHCGYKCDVSKHGWVVDETGDLLDY